MTRAEAYAHAVEIIDETYEIAAVDVERMLTRHGASTSEIATELARMAAEHQRLKTDEIDRVFRSLANGTAH